MAEYNPSKIIKDGNTYNFRDTTKIPLAGSNEISGSLIPSTDGTVNLGSPSYQWNNAYIKSLTINGVAAGDILTHNVSEFVGVSGNQTISGDKTFSNGLFVSKSTAGDLVILEDSSINSTNEDANGMPLTGHTNSVKIKGSQFNVVPCMLTGQLYTSGDTSAELHAYKYKDLTTNAMIAIRYVYANNSGFVQFKNISFIIPNVTSTTNLGSSSLQWNTTYTRNILIDNDINIASSLINKTSTSGTFSLRSGTNYNDGASITLYGKDYNGGLAGQFTLYAYGNSDYTYVRIYPNGTMTVYNNSTNTTKNIAMQEDVIPRSGGAVMTGDLLASSTINSIGFGYGWGNGGTIYTYSPIHSTVDWQGTIRLEPLKTTSNFKTMQLAPGGTWTWSGTACQITSDQRYKQQITEIDDKLLDAWEDVELVQFKYNESVDTKGKSARLHTGYVVQQIDSACKSHGVDISEYGLYCHEEYPEETKEVEVEQADGTKTKETKVIREANEHYSLRYTEALIVECKYLRRCIARLTARIEELEKGNDNK